MKVKKDNMISRKMSGTISLQNRSLDFLMSEAVDRESYETAMKSIEPLSELEDVMGSNMPKTQQAIRRCIRNVNDAISASPDPILSALKLSDPQKKLVDAVTACEVLKFSILNAMDAVRMNFVTDFKKELKFYTDEIISLGVAPDSSGGLRLQSPQRASFSKIKDMSAYETIHQGRNFMIVGPEPAGAGKQVVLRVPGSSPPIGLPIPNVGPGKIYITGRNDEGEPAPVPGGLKTAFLGIAAPSRGILGMTIDELSQRDNKKFDLGNVVKSNFRVPTPAEGMLAGIYRAIRKRPAVQPPDISAKDFTEDLKQITLDDFKKYFETIVAKTEGATGDMTTLDTADTLFFGGLASVSAALGLSKPPPPPPSASGTAAGSGSTAPTSGGASGRQAAGVARQHSFDNFIKTTSMVKGADAAEKAANLSTLLNIIDKPAMRKELNRVVGPNVVFTESTIDRWCELAGIKEVK